MFERRGRPLPSHRRLFSRRPLPSLQLNEAIVQRWLSLESGPLRPLLAFGGFRERLLADNKFVTKLMFEVAIGICTKLTAERERRGAAFSYELDFVVANVIMAVIADFMLVYVPAPTGERQQRPEGGACFRHPPPALALGSLVLPLTDSSCTFPHPRLAVSFVTNKARTSWWQNTAFAKWLDACPGNAFQKVPPGTEPYTLGQRGGAILKKGMTLAGVGFVSSLIGVGFTNSITAVRFVRRQPPALCPTGILPLCSIPLFLAHRGFLDPTFVPQNQPQDVLSTSLAYGAYMAHNSNLRYQLVAGVIEQRMIESAFRNNPAIATVRGRDIPGGSGAGREDGIPITLCRACRSSCGPSTPSWDR